MEDYKQRVVEEKKELDEKISKLVAFTQTDTFSELCIDDCHILTEQRNAMLYYSDILGRRIRNF